MFVTKTSMITGRKSTLWVEGLTQDMLKSWEDGALIQEALSSIPQELREFIMSGITPTEWNNVFPNEEEDVEDWD